MRCVPVVQQEVCNFVAQSLIELKNQVLKQLKAQRLMFKQTILMINRLTDRVQSQLFKRDDIPSVKCMNEVIFCFDYTNMQDYDKLHYTKINASEVCPQNVIIRGLLCLNILYFKSLDQRDHVTLRLATVLLLVTTREKTTNGLEDKSHK
jgi:hypothetical protein